MPRILTPDDALEVRALVTERGPEQALGAYVRSALGRARKDGASGVRHPLGFLCLPLYRSPDFGLCVHVWETSLSRSVLTISPIHSHSWDLTSRVLRGGMDNEVIELDHERPPTHRVCAIVNSGHVDEIRPTRARVGYDVSRIDRVAAGETYTLPAGIFHASRAHNATVTLVLARTRRQAPEFALAHLDTRAHVVTRSAASSRDLQIATDLVGGEAGRMLAPRRIDDQTPGRIVR